MLPAACGRIIFISIHAPHARSDLIRGYGQICSAYFNPRSSCEERRHGAHTIRLFTDFNPRSSCEERLPRPGVRLADIYFNPRSSCEERLCQF